MEVVEADEVACMAMAEAQVDGQESQMKGLTEHDLMDYDYVSVSKDGFVLISVRLISSSTRLIGDVL
jgi:hypothetical protein